MPLISRNMLNSLKIPNMLSNRIEVRHGLKHVAEGLAERYGFEYWRSPTDAVESARVFNHNILASRLHLKINGERSDGTQYYGGLIYEAELFASIKDDNIVSNGVSIMFFGLCTEIRYAQMLPPQKHHPSMAEAGAAMIIYKGLDIGNFKPDYWALTVYQDKRKKLQKINILYGLERTTRKIVSFQDENTKDQKKLVDIISTILK